MVDVAAQRIEDVGEAVAQAQHHHVAIVGARVTNVARGGGVQVAVGQIERSGPTLRVVRDVSPATNPLRAAVSSKVGQSLASWGPGPAVGGGNTARATPAANSNGARATPARRAATRRIANTLRMNGHSMSE